MKFPNKILIGIQEGNCNLSCPKCYTHGESAPTKLARSKGVMDYEKFVQLCNEVGKFGARVTPQTWDEPLLTPGFEKYLTAMKQANLIVTMDTNGILLNEKMAKLLIDLQIDSVFISIDATSADVYKKTRGGNFYNLVVSNVSRLLKLRGEKELPRIGVSFVVEEENQHQEEEFCNIWKEKADVVRVNKVFSNERQTKGAIQINRTPCWSLYDSMMIRNNGDVSLCCVDTHSEINLGNVFESHILDIWNGKKMNSIRDIHEKGNYDQVKICGKCTLWQNDSAVVEENSMHLISKTETHYYINRLDRIHTTPRGNRYVTSS